MGRIVVALSAIGLVLFLRSEASDYPPTAARLPDLIGWVVVGLAALAIVQVAAGWLRSRAAGTLTLAPDVDWSGLLLGAGFLGLIVLYAFSIQVVGYLVATPIFLLVPLAVLRPVSWIVALVTTASITVMIFGVFVWFLNLSIPLYPVLPTTPR